jgi:hypothetical protein
MSHARRRHESRDGFSRAVAPLASRAVVVVVESIATSARARRRVATVGPSLPKNGVSYVL